MEISHPLENLVGEDVVVDLSSPFVCMGTLVSFNDSFLVLKNADMHDLRDTHTSRENYVASSVVTGIKRNRKRVFLAMREVVALAILREVVDE